MKIRFEYQPFEGERIIQTSPEISNRITSEWYSRPNMYTGRALTADTLISNTKHHLRHMQLFGRHLSRGVIKGLALTAYVTEGSEQTEQWLRLTGGIGITNWGDDIVLPETADIFLDHVSVWGSEDLPRGAGIFVMQPLEILDEIVAVENNQCQLDEERDPFDDEQIVDGCRLVFVPWPVDVLGPIPRVQLKQFRNQLVYQIFDFEKAHPDTLFPWEHIGIPVGLAYITLTTGKILFVDREAVVRKGGVPLSTKSMLTMNGTPFLWESRIQQFIGHMYDIRQAVNEIPAAHTYFEVLPPVGVLPRQALDFDTMSTEFFPSQFIIDAAPIPQEQLEMAMNASAGLSPFDLHQPEKIKLLVPVPQFCYEKDLLKREEPDPIFLETLRKLVREIRQWFSNLSYLRNMAESVMGAINVGEIPEFLDTADTIPDEETFPVTLHRDEGITDFAVIAMDAVKKLHGWIKKYAPGVSDSVINPLLPTADNPFEFQMEFKGLDNFILDLQNNIRKTEDILNSGYCKAEADMYRLRQLLLGNVKSSRLATSSALGQIVSGQTRQPSIMDIESYFKTAITTKPGEVEVEIDQVLDLEGKTEDEKLTRAFNIMKKMEAGETLSTKDMYEATQVMTSAFSKRVGGDQKAISMVARPTKVRFETADTYTFKEAETATIKKFKDSVELSRSAVLERSKPLVDRIYESASMEVKSSAVKTKTSIFDSLADIPFEFDIKDEVTVVGSGKAILKASEYDEILKKLGDNASVSVLEGRSGKSGQWVVISTAPLSETEGAALGEDQKKKVNDLLRGLRNRKGVSLKDIKELKDTENDLGRQIRDGFLDPDPEDGDEADYFTAGVSALEHGLNAMRLIEKKLDDYKKAVTQSQNVLTSLRFNAGRWKDKLGEIDDKLKVLRHDALVTRSLFEEERSRLSEINKRRRTILDTHATTLVFVRPRLVDSRLDVPSVPLYAEYVNPVPACLAEDFEATGDLAEMLDVFREVPIAWLTDAKGLVRIVNSPKGVADIIKQSKNRTFKILNDSATVGTASYQTYNTHEYGKAMGKIVYANQQQMQTFAKEKAALDLEGVNSKTWLQLVDQAETQVSLADLIEKGKGFSKLVVKATEIMENLEDVAVSVNLLFNELEPVIKLQWANLISIYDKPVDLRHLETLPSFDKIDFTFRRDLQNMVDWLFSQVDVTIDKARQTMNDLLRICILLACHAPVSTLVNGYVDTPSMGKVGDFIDIVFLKGEIKVGMVATVFTQQAVAVQGVVTDVGEKAARVKVTQSTGNSTEFTIDKGAQVKFSSGKVTKKLS